MVEMDDNNDTWSLLAVVRECSMKTRNKAPASDHSLPIPPTTQPEPAFEPSPESGFMANARITDYQFVSLPAYNNTSSFDELMEMYKPFMLAQPSSSSSTISDSLGSDYGGVSVVQPYQTPNHQHDESELILQQRNSLNRNRQIGAGFPVGIHKKKKLEERVVCRMRLDELSNDKWAWRKYGQKPIKGSPYPRNYYRCSSTKGCTARKQVERTPHDPNMYIVTYTGQHYHARPPLRNLSSRVARQPDSSSSPEEESTNPTAPIPVPDQNGFGIGSGVRFRDPLVNAENDGDHEEEGDDDDDVELIPNSMADPELLMGMKRLMMIERPSGERKNVTDVGNGDGYGYGSGYMYGYQSMMMKEIAAGGSGPSVNLGLVMRGNGLCLGIQQREFDSDSGSGSSSGSASDGSAGSIFWYSNNAGGGA